MLRISLETWRPLPPAAASDEPTGSRPRTLVVSEILVVTGPAVAELRDVGLADDDRAGRLEPLDDDVVLLGNEVAVCDRARHSANALGEDQVLDTYWNSGQRSE